MGIHKSWAKSQRKAQKQSISDRNKARLQSMRRKQRREAKERQRPQ